MSRSSEDNSPKQRYGLEAMWRHLVVLLVLAGALWIASVSLIYFTNDDTIVDLGYRHFPTLFGLPAATAAALALVFVTRAIAGEMSIEFFGFKFKGAAGEAIIWLLCFLAMVYGITATWELQYTPTEPLVRRQQ